MLPSCGHFKNIPCPFYKLALCVRPHCPYKHHSAENEHTRQAFPSLVDETESLLDSKLVLSSQQNGSYIKTESVDTDDISYIPTPVDSPEGPVSILKTSSSNYDRQSTSSAVPEYRPTPISKLKESTIAIKKSNKSEYSPEYSSSPFKKKKYIEEYDPLEVRCVSNKKSVSFIDPKSSDDSGFPVILVSSEDELDDSESAPKFSDDESEEILSPPKNQIPEPTKITEIPYNEPEIEEIVIDEFSLVDKILVDCKKNDILLKAKQNQKPLAKLKELVPKAIMTVKQEKSDEISFLPIENAKAKKNTLEKEKVIKTEKPFTFVTDFKDSKPELKIKKEAILNESKSTKHDSSSKKESKPDKLEKIKKKDKKHIKAPSDKREKVNKICKNSSDNSKVSKKGTLVMKKVPDIDKSPRSKKIVLKIPHIEKSSNPEKRTTLNQPSSKSTVLKKQTNDKHVKTNNLKNSSSLKKNKCFEAALQPSEVDTIKVKRKTSNKLSLSSKKKNESIDSDNDHHSLSHALQSSKSTAHYPKEKSSSSNKHSSSSTKRKSEISDSDSERHNSKHKMSSPSKKKIKTGNSVTLESKNKKHKSSSPKTKKAVVSVGSSDDDFSTNCEELLSMSDSDPDEECRRIFEESYPQSVAVAEPNENEDLSKQNTSTKSTDLRILRKQRFAHPGAMDLKKPSAMKVEAKRQLNPAQVMFNRFAQVQAKFAKHFENKEAASDSSSKGHDKKKLNFVPNSDLLAAVKGKVSQEVNPALSNYSALPPTVSKTLKVTQRVAHIPDAATKPRPVIPAEFGNKVPSNIRQKYLNAFIDECLKFCPSEDDAYNLAIEEEKKAHDRSSSKSLYMNVAANSLKRLRNQAKEGPVASGDATSKNSLNKKTMSHQTVLNGPLAQRRSFSIGAKKQAFDIKDLGNTALYEHLTEYVLTPEQQKENGFPLPHPVEKDRAVIEGIYANRVVYCNDAFKRTCCRCQKIYYVNVDGDYVRDEECDFHWGRLWKKRIAGSIESRYSCCQGDAESDGCCVSTGHVFEGSEHHALKGFVKTLPKTPPRDNFYGIYSLDCEMCYTTAGMELTRVTVIDTELKSVYESFVKPQHKVLDYNTRFSGITEDDLKNVRTTILDVQAVLLCIFNDKTILIGHSLESDLKALKLFHKTIVDTSVVFPHRNGLPFKRALRTLMAEKLNKIIQNDVGGHDSHEDAAACMELMLHKIKEDLKGNR